MSKSIQMLLCGALVVAGCSDGPGEPDTGSLRVLVTSSGTEDQDGYTVTVGAASPETIATSGERVFEDLAPGEHAVMLGDLDEPCRVIGDNPRTVSVTAGGEATVAFTVDCAPGGALRIAAVTEGEPVDPDGYVVRVTGLDGVQAISANGVVEIPHLGAGDYEVTLEGVWVYCGFPGTEAGTRSVTRTVEEGETADVVFDLVCQPALRNRIVFSALRSTTLQVYAIRPDGTGDTPISTPSSEITGSFLTVSRDGTSLVYTIWGQDRSRMELMNSLGEVVGEIPTAVACPTTPGLAPDASRIAFTDCGSSALHVVNIDGTDETRLGDEFGYNATWTPAGDRIVYSRRATTSGSIATMNPSGSDVQPVTALPDELAFDPDVSPDGSKVVFVRARATVPTTTSIHVINMDGTGERLLWEGDAYHAHPSWSPDGSRIVFSQDVPSGLYVIGAQGGTPVALVLNQSSIVWPTWTW
jgi:TolB protein